MQLLLLQSKKYLSRSLSEDLGIGGDITSTALIPEDKKAAFSINARQELVMCGSMIAEYFFDNYSDIRYQIKIPDSNKAQAQEALIVGEGSARSILLLERTILNYLQHLSGIATLTAKYVAEVDGTQARIYDTRKTIPGLRALQKYAVRCGGGRNHRLALDSAILIKDNHIAICGSIKAAIEAARSCAPHYTKVEVECDSTAQVEEAVSCGAEIIMLDNMDVQQIKEAVAFIRNRAVVEVSGGVNLSSVKEMAMTGVDIISIGKLTHSAPAVDIGLDVHL